MFTPHITCIYLDLQFKQKFKVSYTTSGYQDFICEIVIPFLSSGNVLKEITEPAGALIKASHFQLGDPTISILELWGAEYQESTAVLVSQSDRNLLERVAKREKCPVSFVGQITGDKKVYICF